MSAPGNDFFRVEFSQFGQTGKMAVVIQSIFPLSVHLQFKPSWVMEEQFHEITECPNFIYEGS